MNKTIGLCMIVKNEAPVILRCLRSIRALVDYVLIEDTGSTDGTQRIVREYLRAEGLAGEVYDAPWQDFASNRSSVLSRLRQQRGVDYAFVMDADDVLAYAPELDIAGWKQGLTADSYTVSIELGSVIYGRLQLCSNRLPFRYRGVLHEFLSCEQPYTTAEGHGLRIICDRDGARSQAEDKYLRDAEILCAALKGEQDPLLRSRYTFYLAQSYRDHGDLAKALPLYEQRAEQEFWVEERFQSLYQAAHIKAALGYPAHEVIGQYLEAYELCPTRAEALHGAMLYCRNHGRYHQGYLFGRHALQMDCPATGLFLEPWIYRYGLLDELVVLSYWSGHFGECCSYANSLLNGQNLPDMHRERVKANLAFAQQKLSVQPSRAPIPVANRQQAQPAYSLKQRA